VLIPRPPDRRLLAGLLALAVSVGVALAAAATVATLHLYVGAEFPGSIRTSDHTLVRSGWATTIRRDASYESSAPFGEVYTWYSRTYGLGPALYGQGACIVMARSRTFARAIDYDVGIMVCDTAHGRKTIVSRSVSLRLP
jgi:hypothetical protein